MSDFRVEWLGEFLKRIPEVIVDIGAFNGEDCAHFKRCFPNAHVYAFEADPRNYARAKSAEQYGVHVFHCAVTDYTGETVFYSSGGRSEFEASGSVLRPTERLQTDYREMTFTEHNKIQCVTLFDFAAREGIKHIDFLHMDVQGAESRVLRGMGPLRPTLIFLEKSEGLHYEGASGPDELNLLMDSLGYNLVRELLYDNLYLLRQP
jgi:FkbM family methyltransferase